MRMPSTYETDVRVVSHLVDMSSPSTWGEVVRMGKQPAKIDQLLRRNVYYIVICICEI